MGRNGKNSGHKEAVRKNQSQQDCSMVVKGTIAPGRQVCPALTDFRTIRVVNCGEVPILYHIETINDTIPRETYTLDPGGKLMIKNTDDTNPVLVLKNTDNERPGHYTLLITI